VGEEGRERERDRVNSVRAIVLPCGKVTKEKCERPHQREGVMEEKDGERGETDRKGKGCERGCEKNVKILDGCKLASKVIAVLINYFIKGQVQIFFQVCLYSHAICMLRESLIPS